MRNIYIKQEGIKFIINFFGLKITFPYTNSVKYPIDDKLIVTLQNNLRTNTVLMLEANDFHGEIMPGYIKYLIDLGYNVDLLTTEHHINDFALCRFESDKLRTYYTNISTIEKIIQDSAIMDNYSGLFINTLGLFRKDRNIKSPAFINKYFKDMHLPQNGFCINVCHSTEQLITDFPKLPNSIALAHTELGLPVINPCYFGNINITKKNDSKTIFLVSGDLRRDFSIIETAVQKIIDLNITNFELYITGRRKYSLKNSCLSKYINFLGYVNFKDLYALLEKSDYIIACLDPQNKEHETYIHSTTSGCFQLSYGFCKPMIIADKFAQKALVDNNSAILYKQNEDLADAMLKAIKIQNYEYELIQNRIKQITNNLYINSLKNLKEIISRVHNND